MDKGYWPGMTFGIMTQMSTKMMLLSSLFAEVLWMETFWTQLIRTRLAFSILAIKLSICLRFIIQLDGWPVADASVSWVIFIVISAKQLLFLLFSAMEQRAQTVKN